MRQLAQRLRRAVGTFIVDWVAPGMVGFAPVPLSFQELSPEEIHRYERLYGTESEPARQSILVSPLWMSAVEEHQ